MFLHAEHNGLVSVLAVDQSLRHRMLSQAFGSQSGECAADTKKGRTANDLCNISRPTRLKQLELPGVADIRHEIKPSPDAAMQAWGRHLHLLEGLQRAAAAPEDRRRGTGVGGTLSSPLCLDLHACIQACAFNCVSYL